jgi:hypothetical protein
MNKEKLTVETDEEGTTTYRNASGQLHNPDGPAIVYADGSKEHWLNGKLHNENGPAAIYADGFKSHWIHGKLHNSNGPAMVHADGSKEYYINGKLHNPHGPAMVNSNGKKWYYINDKELTEAEFKVWQANQSAPLHNKTATIDGIKYKLTTI